MLFIFYFYSNDDLRDPEIRRQNRFSERRFSEQTSYNRLNGKAWLTAVVLLSFKSAVSKLDQLSYDPVFVSLHSLNVSFPMLDRR